MKSLYEFIDTDIRNANSRAFDIFTIIKPGFLNLSKEIIERFNENGWEVYKTRTKKLLLSEAKELYKIHKDEEWYESLCNYMSSGESMAVMYRKIYDATKTPDIFKETEEIKDAIREDYGESDMRNVMHSSDSLEHMENEQVIYF